MKNIDTLQGMTEFPAHAEQAKTPDYAKSIKRICGYAMLAMLGACTLQIMNSAGDMTTPEKTVVVFASALTLLVIIPMIALNMYFVSRRASSTTATNSSECSHSIKKELMAWALPIATVGVLALLCWGMLHSLDLYKPVEPFMGFTART